jgi:hypothetical protein
MTPILPTPSLALARWPVAEAIAWSLWIAGWIGYAALGVWLAPGQDAAYAPLAACLLGYGLAGGVLGRLPASLARSPALPAVLACLFLALQLSLPATRSLALAAAAGLAWAALGALLSRTWPAAIAAPARAWAGLIGAACAVLVVGDPSDGQGVALRMAVWAALATVLWMAWHRAPAAPLCAITRLSCTCLMARGWPGRWPEQATALVMIPMMTTLPLTLGLCLGKQWPAQGVVALHLLGMFLPALLLRHWAGSLAPAMLRATLAFLLLLGALLVAPGAGRAGSLGLMLLHGTAWGILWAHGLGQGAASAPRSALSGPLPEAALLAVLAFAAGALALRFGPAGIEGIHLALATLACLGLVWAAAAWAWRNGRGIFPLGVKS